MITIFHAILFDLDGLLINSEDMFYHLYLDLLKQYQKSFSLQEYAQNYSGKTAIANMTKIINDYNLPLSIQAGMDFIDEREEFYLDQGIPLKPGAKELLEYLQNTNYKIILATSSTPNRAIRILKQNNIEHYFNDFVFGSELKHGKPEPDVFLMASKKAHTKINECLVLEDSEAGIEASYCAHIPVICIPDLKYPAKEYQDKTFKMMNSLYDVLELLKNE